MGPRNTPEDDRGGRRADGVHRDHAANYDCGARCELRVSAVNNPVIPADPASNAAVLNTTPPFPSPALARRPGML